MQGEASSSVAYFVRLMSSHAVVLYLRQINLYPSANLSPFIPAYNLSSPVMILTLTCFLSFYLPRVTMLRLDRAHPNPVPVTTLAISLASHLPLLLLYLVTILDTDHNTHLPHLSHVSHLFHLYLRL